jgi:hypothetical protein
VLVAGVAADETVELEVTGAGGAGADPAPVIGLFPGNAVRLPVIVSWIASGMLQEVDGSFMPPMSPGHLSIPLSPALQLSIICCRVGTSQPLI